MPTVSELKERALSYEEEGQAEKAPRTGRFIHAGGGHPSVSSSGGRLTDRRSTSTGPEWATDGAAMSIMRGGTQARKRG